MFSLKSTVTVALVGTLSVIGGADAFWRMPCRSRTGLARLDPLVNPGGFSDHTHAIFGGSKFGKDVKAPELKTSECTSCGVTQDKSAYWTPSLHFMFPNGTTVVVPQIGGMLAYYLLYGNNYDGTGKITAFPDGFQMLAGDMNLRNFSNLPVPDPPVDMWTPEMSTESALRQKALGFNCMNYKRDPEPTLYRHFMPDKSYLDANCADGLRLEIAFPSCWNGKDLDSPDHKSHVAYPNFVMTGKCTKGFEVKVPTLLYESIWGTNAFRGIAGQFVLSYGDNTGYGNHGDFLMGWESPEFLQKAVDTCTNLSGNIEDCSIFDIQSEYKAAECNFQEPSILQADKAAGPRAGLPANVPIQIGPAYATKYKVNDPGDYASTSAGSSTVLPSPSSQPVLSYTPKPSSETLGVTGTALPQPQLPAPSAHTSRAGGPAPAPAPSSALPMTSAYTTRRRLASISKTTAAPVMPVNMKGAGTTLPIIGTSYITNPGEVLEIVYVQTYVTVTEGQEPAATPESSRIKRHLKAHKRHVHQHGLLR